MPTRFISTSRMKTMTDIPFLSGMNRAEVSFGVAPMCVDMPLTRATASESTKIIKI